MHDLVHDLARSVMVHEVFDGTKVGNAVGWSCRYALLTDCSKPLEIPTTSAIKIRALRFLNCRRIELCSAAFSSAKSLRVLDLSECHILKLPESIGELKQLRYLNACGISNKTVPNGIANLSKLMYLNLKGSMLTALPDSIGDIKGLLHLDLSDCVLIRKLPESFVNLKRLEYLDVSNCCLLNGVSKALDGLTNIQYLNLSLRAESGNILPLKGIEKVIGNLVELRFLGLCWSMQYIFRDQSSQETFSFVDRICTLSNLEHLDLSCNCCIVNVPQSIGGLRNLHTLNLLNCTELARLPECILNMDSLKVLNVKGCSKLDKSMLSRSKVALLPHFVVHADDGDFNSNIGLLKYVNPNELHISSLDNVKSAEEVQSVKLEEKQGIYDLKLEWTTDSQRSVEDVKVLGELVPPSTLWTFYMKGYNSVRFPYWFTDINIYLPHLIQIELWELRNCTSLPSLGQLQNLQELLVGGMSSITRIGEGFCGGSSAFPRLKKFRLCFMENLEAWNTMCFNGDGVVTQFMFPSLKELSICDCPKLTLKPCPPRAIKWEIENSDGVLSSWEEWGETRPSLISAALTDIIVTVKCSKVPVGEWKLFHHLPAITELSISYCTNLECSSPEIIRDLCFIKSLWLKDNEQTQLPKWLGDLISLQELLVQGWRELSNLQDSMQHLTSLQELCLYECPSITGLPQWLGDLAALKELVISDCTGIRSLPKSIVKLTRLEELCIYGCHELAKWCEIEENKKKLAHIKHKVYALPCYI
ncbi:hypothetical protein EJB05_10000, partial [Eragrostis curvula]